MELPTGIAHLTIVMIGYSFETGIRRNTESTHQHVRIRCLVTLQSQVQSIVKERQVDTEVIAGYPLPSQVTQTDIVRFHGCHIDVTGL